MMRLPSLSETALIQHLFGSPQLYANAFYFMEIPAIGHSRPGWEIEVHFGLPRKALDLSPHQKPGDIDVLLIPRFDNDRFAERAMAIEVKRFFVPLSNRGKSPNQFGAAQTWGLFEDGFPFVGLLHLGLIEPADRSEWEGISQIDSKYPFAEIGKTKVDLDSVQTSNRNLGRLKKLDIPAQAGFNSFSMHLNAEQSDIAGHTVSDWRYPMKNPATSRALVERIRHIAEAPTLVVGHSISGLKIHRAEPND